MSLVFGSDEPVNGPRTHALVIGVGAYLHVGGGTAPIQGLAQDVAVLNSPQVSASAFANWLADAMPRGDIPLGTIELLLGDGPFRRSDGTVFQVDQPVLQKLRTACSRWRERCDRDSGNVAIFYFCGHGIRGDDDFLLAQDFGSDNHRFWENTFRFRRTYNAMANSNARVQLYFVDACRNSPRRWLEEDTTLATGLLGTYPYTDKARDANILYSTSANQFAEGSAEQVSRFTGKLLDCLRKYAGARKGGVWTTVTTGSLVNAVQEIGNPPVTSGTGR